MTITTSAISARLNTVPPTTSAAPLSCQPRAIALVRETMPWQGIPIVGLAEVETTEEVENGTRLTTTKLTATLCRHFQLPTTPTAFRLTDTRGTTYLLGTSNHPYPLITQAQTHAATPSERTAFTLTIEHTSENSLVEILS